MTSEPAPESEPAPSAAAALAVTNPPAPTKVRIDTPGTTIEIEAHEPLGDVVATALRLFHEAGGWPREISRPAGFAQTERRDTPPTQASSMPYAPGPYPLQNAITARPGPLVGPGRVHLVRHCQTAIRIGWSPLPSGV